MPIRIVCDGCGKGIKAPDKYAGRPAKCPNCGQQLVIPASEIDLDEFVRDTNVDNVLKPIPAPPALPIQNNDVAQSTKVAKSNAFPPTDDQIACPYCAEMIKVAATKCRFCGEFLTDQRPVVTEATGKKWKFIQLLGAILMLCGVILFGGMLGLLGLTAGTELEASWFFGLMGSLGLLGLLLGVPCYIVGRVGAWWYHG